MRHYNVDRSKAGGYLIPAPVCATILRKDDPLSDAQVGELVRAILDPARPCPAWMLMVRETLDTWRDSCAKARDAYLADLDRERERKARNSGRKFGNSGGNSEIPAEKSNFRGRIERNGIEKNITEDNGAEERADAPSQTSDFGSSSLSFLTSASAYESAPIPAPANGEDFDAWAWDQRDAVVVALAVAQEGATKRGPYGAVLLKLLKVLGADEARRVMIEQCLAFRAEVRAGETVDNPGAALNARLQTLVARVEAAKLRSSAMAATAGSERHSGCAYWLAAAAPRLGAYRRARGCFRPMGRAANF